LKLSFADDEEQEQEQEEKVEAPKEKKRRMLKDPSIDTSFLPDREREEEERIERELLRKEWITRQEEIKSDYFDICIFIFIYLFLFLLDEKINITYSFWDGSGHRKIVEVSIYYINHVTLSTFKNNSARRAIPFSSFWMPVVNSFHNCVV
jgi:protein FAM50